MRARIIIFIFISKIERWSHQHCVHHRYRILEWKWNNYYYARGLSRNYISLSINTSLLNKPYIEGEEKFLSSPLRSFDVAVSISTEACQTYAIHSFTGIGYRIFAHTQQLYDKSAQIHSKLDRSCILETMKKLKYQSKWKHYFHDPVGMSKHFHTVLHGER